MIWPISLNSPAPTTREWLARICSVRLVPERGMPTMMMGSSDVLPPGPAQRSSSKSLDQPVDTVLELLRVVIFLQPLKLFLARSVARDVVGEGVFMPFQLFAQICRRKVQAGAVPETLALGKHAIDLGQQGLGVGLTVGLGHQRQAALCIGRRLSGLARQLDRVVALAHHHADIAKLDHRLRVFGITLVYLFGQPFSLLGLVAHMQRVDQGVFRLAVFRVQRAGLAKLSDRSLHLAHVAEHLPDIDHRLGIVGAHLQRLLIGFVSLLQAAGGL